ncbi:transposase family protein [Streptomyces cinnamoneus]|uniref:transposase family protein n=1 Tax=Streptomyces cinnamoneus TaxID=53446 RepID=UPI0030B8C9F7
MHLRILADAGYQGLGGQTCGQVVTPPRKRRGKHLEHVQWLMAHHEAARFQHASRRSPVEHGIAHLKNWRSLARHHGRHEHLPETVQAVAAPLTAQQTADRTSTAIGPRRSRSAERRIMAHDIPITTTHEVVSEVLTGRTEPVLRRHGRASDLDHGGARSRGSRGDDRDRSRCAQDGGGERGGSVEEGVRPSRRSRAGGRR